MLYIISTPIGNLKDITLRAIETLKGVDFIACEDTRKTSILLNHCQIKKPLLSYYSYNQIKRGEEILRLLNSGKSIALVSDSGTPGISDPGTQLIKLAIENNIPLTVIPGPTAFVAALSLSGLPTHKFAFEGFLPKKEGQRKKRLSELSKEKRTVILYESPYRIKRLLGEILGLMGDREIAVLRELTKKFEEVKRGLVSGLISHFAKVKPRGEFIVVISGGK
ncbi:MAG: 16S rRNA (cytidine(1402)-2'-O)-methyltransferase [Candidatus Omnitrophota bacterium]